MFQRWDGRTKNKDTKDFKNESEFRPCWSLVSLLSFAAASVTPYGQVAKALLSVTAGAGGPA
jgi:hypothetical protein